MARFHIRHEVQEPPNLHGWVLCFQFGTYCYDDRSTEDGYRFIWRRPDGSLLPARGQARIPSIAKARKLMDKALAEGWGGAHLGSKQQKSRRWPQMPNFFDYANNERSQDSVICWLIKWSAVQAQNPEGGALRDLGRAFVKSLLGKHRMTLNGEIQNAEIYQQDCNIDILARITTDTNAEHVLLIEDKTAPAPTGEGENPTPLTRLCHRLRGYSECVEEGRAQLGTVHEHWPIYLTTANQSLAKDRTIQRTTSTQETPGFEVFRRNDFLEVLNGYQGTHPIVTDFRDRLLGLENDFRGFEAWTANDPEGAWSWAGWEGFYRHLEGFLEGQLEGECESEDGWGHVSFPGDFLGFGRNLSESNFYLLLEVYPGDPNRQRLCFKVYRGEINHPSRESFRNLLFETARDLGLETRIQPPEDHAMAGPDHGHNITFGRFEPWLAYNEDGTIDFNEIVTNWQQAWGIIREVSRLFHQQ